MPNDEKCKYMTIIVRIGNLLVPNNNYVKFEEWLMPILDKLLEEQNNNGVVWTPSKIIHRLGELSFGSILLRENIRLLIGWDWRSTMSLQYTTGLQSEFCKKFGSKQHFDYLQNNTLTTSSLAIAGTTSL